MTPLCNQNEKSEKVNEKVAFTICITFYKRTSSINGIFLVRYINRTLLSKRLTGMTSLSKQQAYCLPLAKV